MNNISEVNQSILVSSSRKQKLLSEQLPDSIDFNFCCVHQVSQREVMVENKNPFPVSFSIEGSSFEFSPKQGQINPRQCQKILISYTPKEAKVIVASALFSFSNEPTKVIKLSVIGKIPYMTISRSKIDFDYLLVGQKASQDVIIKNQSQVECVFKINKKQEDNFNDNSFSTDISSGSIPPKSTFLIKMFYQPKVVNLISVQHFEVECIGGNSQTLQVSGIGQSYLTYLSTNSLNFGEIKHGQKCNKIITLYNDSDSATKFEFFNQQGNVFSLNKNTGTIESKSQTRIIVYFNPRTTVSYYQRIYCIVRNHSLLYLDMMGSCYDLLVRPLPIVQRHIDLFRNRVIQGRITKLDIKYLENAMVSYMGGNLNNTQNFKTSHFNNQLQQQIQQQDDKSNNSMYNETEQDKAQFSNQLALHKELFQEQKSEHRIVYLSDDFIDFGFTGQNQTSLSRDFEIYNNLSCQMTILWTMNEKNQDNNSSKDLTFKVFPQSATLKPLSSCKFEIQFTPDKNSQYYYQEVQYFAIKSVSSLQNKKIEELKRSIVNNGQSKFNNLSRISQKMNSLNINNSQILVDEQIPSFSGYVKCIGHSFDLNYQTFIPIVELQPSKNVMFQSCGVDHVVYQTVELINKTDTPTYFQFSPDVSQIFSIYPVQGLVQGKSFKILTIQFQPKETKIYQSQLVCSLNHNSSNKLTINCNGICGQPSLQIENQGKVYFPPAYAGLYSTQKVGLQNKSRVPVDVKLQIPDKYYQEVHLNPKQLKLKPHESSNVEIAFIPLQKKKYKIQVPIKIYNILDISQQQVGYFMPGSGSEYQLKKLEQKNQNISEHVVQEYNLTIFGQGSDGALKMHPHLIDFNIVKVNFNKKQYVTLENNSDCTFWVELQLKQNVNSASEDNQSIVDECFQLDFQQGVIAAHSKVDIGITFSPTQVVDMQLDLECWAKERPMKGVFGMSQTFKKLVVQKCKVNIKGSGSYPNLKIVDVRNDSVSVATLWENFCINQINHNLSQNLNNDEKQFLQIETLNFQEAQSVMKRLQAYQWNFGYLPLNQITKPRKIVITIQNKGGTELDWNFKLPSDSQIEVEPWADPGEPSLEEAFEKVIIEKKIFDIIPRSGHLEPQKSADIELIYNPKNFSDDINNFSESEQHFLQVILQIVNGKPLLIHLTGNTLAPNKGKIAVKKNHYQLPDMPIGQLLPVSFPIEITNVGCININYKVEVKEILEKGQKVQSQFNIFDIKKDVDNIPQGQKQYIYCLFRPLEPKNYTFELTIHVYDNVNKIDEQVIRVEGLGYFNNPPKQIQTKVQEIPSARSKYSSIGSNVFFSIEEIDFGELESGKSEHRILLLYNVSKTNRFSFKFNQTGLVCMDDLLLDPMSGTVEPEQFIEIKLSLISKTVPAVYEGEIECKIQWEAVKTNDLSNDSSVQNVFEQKQLLEKETLFLRIKKKSKLQNQSTSIPYEHTKNENNESENIFEILMKSAIRDILNDPELDQILDRVDDQPIQLFNQFDNQKAVDITQIQNLEQRDDNYKNKLLNFKDDYTNLFMNQEFIVLVDNIMENTFFNIIQETTRREADLLKISNTYLTPNR